MTSAEKVLIYKRTNGQFSGITVEGTGSSTLVSNAANGKTAYDGTAQYRAGSALSYVSITTSYRVIANFPDNQSAQVYLYCDYTQGANKISHFNLIISDGTATHVLRVRALTSMSAEKYVVVINRMPMNKSINVTLESEFIAATGTVRRNDGVLWSFTTDGNTGTSYTATNVGELDWAGGNVWFDTEQYRNNYPPTNAPASGMLAAGATPAPGAGVKHISLSGLSYTQGTNIATHLAILVRYGGGTISLTTDCIVALLNLASLPSTFTIPYAFHGGVAYTVGIAVCALTKNGYSFNTTVRSYAVAADTALYIYGSDSVGIDGQEIIIDPGATSTARTYFARKTSFADDIELASGKVVKINGNQIIGARGAAVANATDAASTMARLNDLLSRLRAHGLIAT
jgi:hypothetical protein